MAREPVRPQPPPKAAPERITYALERAPDNQWIVLTLRTRGDVVVSSRASEPDTFAAQLGRIDAALRRLVL